MQLDGRHSKAGSSEALGPARHLLISKNLVETLRGHLHGTPWTVRDSTQRVKVQATGFACFPDVSIYPENLEYDLEDPELEAATNPAVLIEVLSNSTEGYDRGVKARNYRQISSLGAYVFIS